MNMERVPEHGTVIVEAGAWNEFQDQIRRAVDGCNLMLDAIQQREQFKEVAGQDLVEWMDEEIRNLRSALDEIITPF